MVDDLWERYRTHLREVERLRQKTDGRPIPEEKKQRCLNRLKDLEKRIIPALVEELNQNPQIHTGLWD